MVSGIIVLKWRLATFCIFYDRYKTKKRVTARVSEIQRTKHFYILCNHYYSELGLLAFVFAIILFYFICGHQNYDSTRTLQYSKFEQVNAMLFFVCKSTSQNSLYVYVCMSQWLALVTFLGHHKASDVIMLHDFLQRRQTVPFSDCIEVA